MNNNYAFERVSLIFPCFNEQENLTRFKKEVFDFFDAAGLPYECVLVDDGSSDGTYSLAHALASEHTHVVLARHDGNKGLGAAVRTGIAAATGDAILTMDADLTFSPADALKVIHAYGPGIDCVIGSPMAGGFEEVPWRRRVLSQAVNWLYRFLLSQPVTAASSILRLYRSSRLNSLPLESTGFDINAEIIFKLVQQKAKIIEIPVVLTTRTLGHSKLRTFPEIKNHLKMFCQIIKWKM